MLLLCLKNEILNITWSKKVSVVIGQLNLPLVHTASSVMKKNDLLTTFESVEKILASVETDLYIHVAETACKLDCVYRSRAYCTLMIMSTVYVQVS